MALAITEISTRPLLRSCRVSRSLSRSSKLRLIDFPFLLNVMGPFANFAVKRALRVFIQFSRLNFFLGDHTAMEFVH